MRSYFGFRSTYLSCIAVLFTLMLMSTILSGCSKGGDSGLLDQSALPGQAYSASETEELASADALSQNKMAQAAPPMRSEALPEGGEASTSTSAPSEPASAPVASDRSSLYSDNQTISGQNAVGQNSVGQNSTFVNQPQIIKTATLSLQVKEMEPTLNTLHALVKQHHGLFTNESIALAGESGGYRSAELEIRVPQQHLDTFLKGVKGIGTVQQLTVTGEDVGAEMVDNASRIRNLKAEEAALQQVMKRAGKIPEVLEVARELARVRGEIEQVQGRLNFLKQQVSYSTVHLNLSEQSVSSTSSQKPGWETVVENSWHQVLDALDSIVRMALTLGVWTIAFFLPVATLVIVVIYGFVRLLMKLLRKLFHCKSKNKNSKTEPETQTSPSNPNETK